MQSFEDPSADPYLAVTLKNDGAYLSNFYGIGHDSADNYIAQVSGQAPDTQTHTHVSEGPVAAATATATATATASEADTVAERLDAQQRVTRIRAAIARLPRHQREVIE
ncbi:MAG: hypothetical protein ACRDN0_16885, partial [Trebonia sp.]